MHAGVRDWDTVMSCGREFRRKWSMGHTEDVDRGEGKLQLVICCLLEAETRTMEEGWLLACSAPFLIYPRLTCPEKVWPTVDRTLLHQLANKTVLHRHAHRSIWWAKSHHWDSFLQGASRFVSSWWQQEQPWTLSLYQTQTALLLLLKDWNIIYNVYYICIYIKYKISLAISC